MVGGPEEGVGTESSVEVGDGATDGAGASDVVMAEAADERVGSFVDGDAVTAASKRQRLHHTTTQSITETASSIIRRFWPPALAPAMDTSVRQCAGGHQSSSLSKHLLFHHIHKFSKQNGARLCICCMGILEHTP